MTCLHCDGRDFVEKPDAELEQEFRGETLKVVSPAMSCTKCGWVTVAIGQLDELSRRTADEYRRKHGLLTSGEIRARREALKMSVRTFAEFLGVGEASVKRWENWQVQDASSDRLIRLACAAREFLGAAGFVALRDRDADALEDAMRGVLCQACPIMAEPFVVQISHTPWSSEFVDFPRRHDNLRCLPTPPSMGLKPPSTVPCLAGSRRATVLSPLVEDAELFL